MMTRRERKFFWIFISALVAIGVFLIVATRIDSLFSCNFLFGRCDDYDLLRTIQLPLCIGCSLLPAIIIGLLGYTLTDKRTPDDPNNQHPRQNNRACNEDNNRGQAPADRHANQHPQSEDNNKRENNCEPGQHGGIVAKPDW
jgi:hypothetical protein